MVISAPCQVQSTRRLNTYMRIGQDVASGRYIGPAPQMTFTCCVEAVRGNSIPRSKKASLSLHFTTSTHQMNMANIIPAKSILKQQTSSTDSTTSDEQKAKADRDRRNLGIALYHANKIQAQKDAEAAILTVIEKLLDYPADSTYTATEASLFRTLIVPFQPSDFDSLVEERRIARRCGYPLCPILPRACTLGANASWRLKGKGAADYCSKACLQKALYVKAQLSEIPAWERQPGQEPEIALPLEDRTQSIMSASHPARDSVQISWNERQDLAAERGESASSFRPNQVMHDTIVEKRNMASKPQTLTQSTQPCHNAIEGHVPFEKSPSSDPAAKQPVRNKPAKSPDDRQQVDEEEESWNVLYENLAAE